MVLADRGGVPTCKYCFQASDWITSGFSNAVVSGYGTFLEGLCLSCSLQTIQHRNRAFNIGPGCPSSEVTLIACDGIVIASAEMMTM